MSHKANYRLVEDEYHGLAGQIREWGRELGFQALGITDTELGEHEQHLFNWLGQGWHGEMAYMERHGTKRSRPAELEPGTVRVISARMDYWPPNATPIEDLLEQPQRAAISRYALGRDYHKVLRRRLAKLAARIEAVAGGHHRALVDSAPVLEKALAEKAGIGWIGKHTNLLHQDAGGWFFLGEIYTDIPLPVDQPATEHCGSCRRCIDICPTGAIRAPYQLDARRCISYLTIEHRSSIPEALRPLIGNRIYGCDDCQAVCPWNKFAQSSGDPDFAAREALDAPLLVDLFAWSEEQFLERTRGNAIRRIGHELWLRNIAVALGNAPTGDDVIAALRARADHPSALVREHVAWALRRHGC